MNPIILYDNRYNDGAPAATDTASGYDVANIKDMRTYTFWKGASAGTKYITVDCGSAKAADTLAVISHNLKTASASVSLESSTDNSNWTERIAAFTPASDKAFLKTFTSASARYWRIKIVTASIAAQLAVAFIGVHLLFPYPPDTPYTPVEESVEVLSSRSKKGHILGSLISFKPLRFTARFSTLLRTWVFNTFKPFWDTYGSEFKPFFWAWDIDTYPEDIYFVKFSDSYTFKSPLSVLLYADTLELDMEGSKE